MKLHVGSYRIPITIEGRSSVVSKHTGKQLQLLSIRFQILGENENDEFLDIIKNEKKAQLVANEHTEPSSNLWVIKNNSYSYVSNQHPLRYTHNLELVEFEELKIDKLMLDDLLINPYFYDEELSGEDLILEVKTILNDKENLKLNELMKGKTYFPVQRIGISDQPLEMRFGQCLWSKNEDGFKHHLRIVQKTYDREGIQRGLCQPQTSNMESMLAENYVLLEQLLMLLQQKGLVASDEIQQIKKSAKEKNWETRREFDRVEDIDQF
jgi:hypothetical protein